MMMPRGDGGALITREGRFAAPLLVPLFFVLLCLGVVTSAFGQADQGRSLPVKVQVPKEEKEGVWQPADGGVQITLWPENIPLAKPDSGDHPEHTGNGSTLIAGQKWHWATYVTRPTMTLYRSKGQNSGAAVLVIPGGGFNVVATDLEGTEICDWVTQQGMTCAMLKYRTPQRWLFKDGKQQRPELLLGLEDSQRAMSVLRQLAADYGIDPGKIGAIGFSAGAYLIINMSNTVERTYPLTDDADRQSPRPDFAVVVYTARVLDDSEGRNSLELQPWVQISPKAPPTLIIHAMDDAVDNVRQPLAYALALNDAGVPVDVRLYAKGGHAFGMRPAVDPVTREWPAELRTWMETIGVLLRSVQ
jgi:acetyl esterase/lipase